MNFIDNRPKNILNQILDIPAKPFIKNSRRQNAGQPLSNKPINLQHTALSHREKHLLHLIQNLGWSYEAIAQKLDCSKQSVYMKVRKIKSKVG